MMKLFFNLVLFAVCPILLFSQNDKTVEVTYVKAYKNHKDTSDAAPRIMKSLEYQLLCNVNESRFEYISAMMNDGDKTNQRFIGAGGGSGVYYKNLKEKKKVRHVNKYGEDFLIQEDFNRYNWQLYKNETKKILGYDCYKAVATYSTYIGIIKKTKTITKTVWYAPSIPLSHGPSGYDGLPGLVLEAVSGSFYFMAKDIKFHEKPVKIKVPKKGKEITLEEFNTMLTKHVESLKQ